MNALTIRQKLLARRSTLLSRYRNGVDRADEELAEPQPEDVERAAEQWDARLISSLGDADVAQLGDVVAAIVRLEAGSYGRCTMCDNAIAERRLEVIPETALCVSCSSIVSSSSQR